MSTPNVCVLKTDGINCEKEMKCAFETAGADAEVVHINQLRSREKWLGQYAIMAIPGGFSYGDDIASGQVLANELKSYLSDQLQEFVDQEKPIIGVCNGFQTLVRTGLLPNRTLGEQQVTLTDNEVGRFECRWIELEMAKSACKFFEPGDFDETIPMQTAHGEGRFFARDEDIQRLNANQQVVFRYTSRKPGVELSYPDDPNGSIDRIAGITDPTGLIIGMMPHPERSITAFHPHRSRTPAGRRAADVIFGGIVSYARKS